MAQRRPAVRRRPRQDDDERPEEAGELAEDNEELAEDDERPEDADDELAEDDDELAEDDGGARDGDGELAEDDDGGTRRRPRRSRLSAAKAGQLGLRQISELTGKQPEGVTGVEPSEDGWIVGVEVVEDRRIPSSTDVLAIYETDIDASGDLVSYRRVKRYMRGRGDSEDS